jgi:hypothetical protein
MKKTILSVMVVSVIALTSCKKTDPATPAEPGTCNISGIVQAPLDLSNDTLADGTYSFNENPELVASGNLTFIVDSRDLDNDPDPSFTYQELSFSTAINAGNYSIDVPAIVKPLMVEVYADDFNAEQRQFIASNPDSVVNESMMFHIGTVYVSDVTSGAKRVQNLMYNDY